MTSVFYILFIVFYALIIKEEDYFIFLIGNDGDGGIFCTLFLSFHKNEIRFSPGSFSPSGFRIFLKNEQTGKIWRQLKGFPIYSK